MATVLGVATPTPITVTAGTTLADCAVLMDRHRIRHLLIVDDRGRLVGVVLDFEAAMRGAISGGVWLAYDQCDAWLLARDVQRSDLPTVGTHEPLDTALAMVGASLWDVIVIVDDRHRPVGIFTEHDAVRLGSHGLPNDAVRDAVNNRPLITLDADEVLSVARQRMLDNRVRHLLVVEPDGVLLGVVSFRDVALPGRLAPTATSRDGLARPLIAGAPTLGVKDACKLMVDEKIGCLPLIDADGRPVGLVTRTDVARLVQRHLSS